jgi:hypothetical protein
MKSERAEKIANAVLYEGYMLYPYRPSAVKNQQRWNFGTLYPPQFHEVCQGTERSFMHAECLLENGGYTEIEVRARFLQLDRNAQSTEWDEAVERVVTFACDLKQPSSHMSFSFPGKSGVVSGSIRATITQIAHGLHKLSLDLANDFPADPDANREQILPNSLLSAHILLGTKAGAFVSLLEPPDALRQAVADCRNNGCFPVLVGDQGQRNMVLCSPIILYDHPQIAPESAGDFFDGTEMDEMLTLRVITLTEQEKNEMRAADARARNLLERTEQTSRDQLIRTHGTIRSLRPLNE